MASGSVARLETRTLTRRLLRMIEDEGLNSELFSRNRKEEIDLKFGDMRLRTRNDWSMIPISLVG